MDGTLLQSKIPRMRCNKASEGDFKSLDAELKSRWKCGGGGGGGCGGNGEICVITRAHKTKDACSRKTKILFRNKMTEQNKNQTEQESITIRIRAGKKGLRNADNGTRLVGVAPQPLGVTPLPIHDAQNAGVLPVVVHR